MSERGTLALKHTLQVQVTDQDYRQLKSVAKAARTNPSVVLRVLAFSALNEWYKVLPLKDVDAAQQVAPRAAKVVEWKCVGCGKVWKFPGYTKEPQCLYCKTEGLEG